LVKAKILFLPLEIPTYRKSKIRITYVYFDTKLSSTEHQEKLGKKHAQKTNQKVSLQLLNRYNNHLHATDGKRKLVLPSIAGMNAY